MESIKQEKKIVYSAIQATGIPDKVIIEEYEGQKIDDIRRYDVDIFTVGSDWIGYFDYLNEYCKVVYLPRTEGVSSSEIRANESGIRLGLVGYSSFLNKFYKESKYVNAIRTVGLCSSDVSKLKDLTDEIEFVTDNFDQLLEKVDAVYIHSHPQFHYEQCKKAILGGKHVLCESPIAKTEAQCNELIELANKNKCILMEAIRTADLTAYSRLLLLLKAGKIGRVVSIDATCTSLSTNDNFGDNSLKWGALEAWGPTALLPVLQVLGTDYEEINVFSIDNEGVTSVDGFTKLNFLYNQSTASIKVGTSVKSEGELIISGTKGYIYVPAPWWKTDYFEVRYENSLENKRYFYQVNGEGIRYELVELAHAIHKDVPDFYIERETSIAIADIFSKYKKKESLFCK